MLILSHYHERCASLSKLLVQVTSLHWLLAAGNWPGLRYGSPVCLCGNTLHRISYSIIHVPYTASALASFSTLRFPVSLYLDVVGLLFLPFQLCSHS